MLAKAFRFHGHQAVRRIYRQGRPVHGRAGSLHVYEGDEKLQTKAAVVVSKKVHKSAVVRNRIRRRIYEVVRLRQPSFRRPAQLVFTIKDSDLANAPAPEIAQAVEELLKKARLL